MSAKPAKRHKRKKIAKKLFTKNRLVILNEDTFEEKFSLRLTLMNVFVVATLGAVVIITVTTFIIAFTPLREYIPGYASDKLKKDATHLALQSDSLLVAMRGNEAYLNSIKRVLTGDLDHAKLNKDSILAAPSTAAAAGQEPTDQELKLRQEVAHEDKYNLFEKAQAKADLVLFAPLKGTVTRQFSPRARQYAVEIAVAGNTPVKSVQSGAIVFADWTPSNGYVILVRHNFGFLSVYKNAASLTKSEGDVVKTGEVIALAGATKTGAHLQFELWKDGFPIDPQQFISFQ